MKILTLFFSLFIFSCFGQEVDSTAFMRIQMLEEVNIEHLEMKKENYILGTYKENTRLLGLHNGFETNCYSQVAVYIPCDNQRSIIKSILINVRNLNKDSLYDVILYDVKLIDNSNNYIPNKVVFSYTSNGEVIKNTPIDISALKLKIPENGLFVAFRGIDFDYKTTDNITDKRTLFQVEGGVMVSKWMYLIGYKKIENARFGLLMQKR